MVEVSRCQGCLLRGSGPVVQNHYLHGPSDSRPARRRSPSLSGKLPVRGSGTSSPLQNARACGLGGVPPPQYHIRDRRLIVKRGRSRIQSRKSSSQIPGIGVSSAFCAMTSRREGVSYRKCGSRRTAFLKTGGRSLSLGALYELLAESDLCPGRFCHREEAPSGQHEANTHPAVGHGSGALARKMPHKIVLVPLRACAGSPVAVGNCSTRTVNRSTPAHSKGRPNLPVLCVGELILVWPRMCRLDWRVPAAET